MDRRFLRTRSVPFILAATIVGAGVAPRPANAGPPGSSLTPPERRLVIATHDEPFTSTFIRAVKAAAPWTDATPSLPVPNDAILRFAGGRLYVISPTGGAITAIDPGSWSVTNSYTLAAGLSPRDLAVVGRRTAYVVCAGSAQLRRLDLITGAVELSTNLGIFADADGNPDAVSITAFEGRLFVSMSRINQMSSQNNLIPAIAVVDAPTGSLVDADPIAAGIQPILLQGTFPVGRMQVLRESRRLYVKASGSFHDAGGIEEIDLDQLRSNGLRISEWDDNIGADLNAFVMINADDGYLTFSTDLLLSSHLHRFSFSTGPDNGPDILTSLNYMTPAMVHDASSGLLYVPNGPSGPPGVFVLNAATGAILTPQPIAAPYTTDLALIVANCPAAGDVNADGAVDGRDIASFVSCLTEGAGCPCEDLDGDGHTDAGDLHLMIALLLSPA